MNPLKLMQKVVPDLAKVLESIHAHLEKQLEVQQQILNELKKKND